MKTQTIKIQGNEYVIVKNLSMKYFDRDFNVDYVEFEVTKF